MEPLQGQENPGEDPLLQIRLSMLRYAKANFNIFHGWFSTRYRVELMGKSIDVFSVIATIKISFLTLTMLNRNFFSTCPQWPHFTKEKPQGTPRCFSKNCLRYCKGSRMNSNLRKIWNHFISKILKRRHLQLAVWNLPLGTQTLIFWSQDWRNRRGLWFTSEPTVGRN